MSTWIHRTFIIPANLIDSARNMAECINQAAAGMFTTAVSPTGTEPATAYISSGLVEDFWGPLFYTEVVDEETQEVTKVKTSPEYLYGACLQGAEEQGKTLTATLQDVSDLLEFGDVSDEPGMDVLNRLGLQMVRSEEELLEE